MLHQKENTGLRLAFKFTISCQVQISKGKRFCHEKNQRLKIVFYVYLNDSQRSLQRSFMVEKIVRAGWKESAHKDYSTSFSNNSS